MASKFLSQEHQARVGIQKAEAPKAETAAVKPALAEPGLPELEPSESQLTFRAQSDAPACHFCGSIMVRNGACYRCANCGSTSGCS
jgi:ribonucleoside-diphosphate reductase alpha chain